MRNNSENHRLRTCIWLVELLKRKKKMTLKEINEEWKNNVSLSGGLDLERRTFINYKRAIADMFNVIIECDNSNGFTYSITCSDNEEFTDWLTRSVSTNESLAANADLKDRILLEQVPSGEGYLAPILDAMRDSKKIAFNYQRFHDLAEQHITGDPYAVKIYHQRWYVLVKEHRTLLCSHEKVEEMHVYSFDRMSDLRVLDEKFKFDKDFNAKDYFKYSWGVRVYDEEPVTLQLKVQAVQRQYFRTLPLHHSQVETVIEKDYSIFEYTIVPSVELYLQILEYGNLVEVLSPAEIRDEIKYQTYKAFEQYMDDDEREEFEESTEYE